MKRYFLILGIIELIAVFVGAIYFVSVIVESSLPINEMFKLIVWFILYLFFAPAFGLLFISHSRSLSEKEIVYEDGNKQQNYNNVLISDNKIKKVNETFIVGDTVECIDVNLLNQYGFNLEGKVVYVYEENIGVEFYNDKGHYTLSLSENQIRRATKTN